MARPETLAHHLPQEANTLQDEPTKRMTERDRGASRRRARSPSSLSQPSRCEEERGALRLRGLLLTHLVRSADTRESGIAIAIANGTATMTTDGEIAP